MSGGPDANERSMTTSPLPGGDARHWSGRWQSAGFFDFADGLPYNHIRSGCSCLTPNMKATQECVTVPISTRRIDLSRFIGKQTWSILNGTRNICVNFPIAGLSTSTMRPGASFRRILPLIFPSDTALTRTVDVPIHVRIAMLVRATTTWVLTLGSTSKPR